MGDNGNAPPIVVGDFYWARTTTATSGDQGSTTFTWTIEDFKNHLDKENGMIWSPSFSVTGPNDKKTNWQLTMLSKEPVGHDDVDDNSRDIVLFLEYKDDFDVTDEPIEKISFSLSILNERFQKEKTKKVIRCISDVVSNVEISLKELEDSPHLLPNGNLTVVCDLTVYSPEATPSVSGFPCEKLAPPIDNCLKQMSEPFGKFFGNKKFSDVKIISGDEEFHCHRIILSGRSPVFEAMFRTDMIENNSEEVPIKDIDPKVVREMLHFIYNGATSTETVMEEIGKELLGAAEMYQLDLLKEKCEEKLCSFLDVSNSVELLVLADLHRASKLRSMALSLVARNMDTIVKTDVYQDFIIRHPVLTLEVTKALVQKAGSKKKRKRND